MAPAHDARSGGDATPRQRKVKQLDESQLRDLERTHPEQATRIRRLQSVMKELGWSASRWSKAAGLSRSALSWYLSAESDLTEATARKLATATELPFYLNPGWLLAWADEPREIPREKWERMRPATEPPRTGVRRK